MRVLERLKSKHKRLWVILGEPQIVEKTSNQYNRFYNYMLLARWRKSRNKKLRKSCLQWFVTALIELAIFSLCILYMIIYFF